MFDSLCGRKVSVVGASRSGLAVSALLKLKGAQVFVSEISPADEKKEAVEELKRLDILFEFGEHSERVLNSDFIVVSPGVALDISILLEAKKQGIPVYSEIEVASWFVKVPIYAITGTNGKSTTVNLLHRMLLKSGLKSVLVGNIGYPFSKAVLENKEVDCFVLEVSSYQLETIYKFRPRIGAILNLTPDHLDRHKTMDSYVNAKLRIAMNQREDDTIWVNAHDRALREARFISRRYFFDREGIPLEGAGVENGRMIVLGMDIIGVNEIKLKGPHNLENSLCASGMALQAGASPKAIADVLREFKGLEHRMEFVAEIDGVKYINDSKGTNVVSTLMALDSFKEPIILIAGGRGKRAGYDKLARRIVEKVRFLIVLGEDGPLIREAALKEGFKEENIVSVSSMKEAVETARNLAKKGDCVLLSPACASFDMFSNFEERGRVFKREVLKLQQSSL